MVVTVVVVVTGLVVVIIVVAVVVVVVVVTAVVVVVVVVAVVVVVVVVTVLVAYLVSLSSSDKTNAHRRLTQFIIIPGHLIGKQIQGRRNRGPYFLFYPHCLERRKGF